MDDVPDDIKDTVRIYKDMSPTMREKCEQFDAVTCTHHSLNLEGGAGHKQELLAANYIRKVDLAAKVSH